MRLELAGLLQAELAKSWRERRCAALQDLFAGHQTVSQRQEMRLAVWFVAILYVLFAAADFVLIPDMFGVALAARVAIAIVYAGGIAAQIDRGVATSVIELQCGLGVVVGFTAWLSITAMSAHEQNILYYAFYGPVFMMVANLFYSFRTSVALLTSGLITIVFFWFNSGFAGASPEYHVAAGLLYVASLGLTLLINFKLNVERYRVFLNALSAEIQHEQARARGEELLKLSKTDALTGLANRRATNDILQDFWAAWTTEREPFAVALIDIDFFKVYNDHYGHQRGDNCLVGVAQAMETAVRRHGGTIGRFGGEEFIVFLPSSTPEGTLRIADDLRCAVQRLAIAHEARPDHLSVVTVSVGAALCRDMEDGHAERLISEADQALYLAKDGHRNCVRLFDRTLRPEARRNGLLDVVRTALVDGRVSSVYQPIWNARTGGLFAAEALMRIEGAGGAPISPSAFIPLLEQSGSIVEFGEWMIRQGCRQLASSPALPIVSINVSSVQIARPGFAATVRDILAETRAAPARLALEITEGTQLQGNDDVLRSIAELRSLGVKVWLDDFGTGYAGPSCLGLVGFDTVKIDKFFVQGSGTPQGAALLRNMVRLVVETGSNLVVEGVETVDQVDLAGSFGVELMQGFHFGRPMSADALEERALGGRLLAGSGIAA